MDLVILAGPAEPPMVLKFILQYGTLILAIGVVIVLTVNKWFAGLGATIMVLGYLSPLLPFIERIGVVRASASASKDGAKGNFIGHTRGLMIWSGLVITLLGIVFEMVRDPENASPREVYRRGSTMAHSAFFDLASLGAADRGGGLVPPRPR
jgi:hypothetical protein